MSLTCQHCGATTDDDARVMCPSCGRRISDPDETTEAAPPPPYAATPPPDVQAPPPFGAPPPYGAAPVWAGGPVPPSSPRPAVLFDRTATKRAPRLTVAFRLLLVLPHFVVAYLWGIAAGIVGIIAWFAALFTARVPVGMYDFIGGYVAYSARVHSYAMLLTNRWPTISGESEYPVVFQPPGPERLNRAAVLFRWILVFPASVVQAVALIGTFVFGVFSWLIALILGRVPVPIFDAVASVVRYQTRVTAYWYLLTSTYPGGLFGEAGDGDGTRPDGEPQPPAMSKGARRLVATFVVVGALSFGAPFAAGVFIGASDVGKAHNASDALFHAYTAMKLEPLASCNTAADKLSCFKQVANQDASVVKQFRTDADAIDYPSRDHAKVAAMDAATQKFLDDLNAIAGATSVDLLNTVISSIDLEGDGQGFDSTVTALGKALDTLS